MKLVMILVVRNEADILDATLAFHLNAGVDFVIATDHRSEDGTAAILASYAGNGCLHVTREDDEEYREARWRTRMARLAATEYGADWVIHSDADEFRWSRTGNLKDQLAAVPPRYGLLPTFVRPFVPLPDDGAFFAERMTVRLATQAPIHDPVSSFRPVAKLIHRADPKVTVGPGAHMVSGTDHQPLWTWFAVELLHFPIRSLQQIKQKASIYRASNATRFHNAHRAMHVSLGKGGLRKLYRQLAIDEATLARGITDGSLVADTRLRDALRKLAGNGPLSPAAGNRAGRFALPVNGRSQLSFSPPTAADTASYALDGTMLAEADVVRARRRLDELETRIARLEGHGDYRVARSRS